MFLFCDDGVFFLFFLRVEETIKKMSPVRSRAIVIITTIVYVGYVYACISHHHTRISSSAWSLIFIKVTVNVINVYISRDDTPNARVRITL